MKLTAIILFTACLAASANGFSQKITLDVKDVPIEKVFQEIKKQSGYTFVYRDEWLQLAQKVDLQLNNVSINEALQAIFKNQPLSYALVQTTVVVKLKDPLTSSEPELVPPPPIDVHGRVVNENGEPVVVTVLIKETNHGTTTNPEGYFELKGVDENSTLLISGVSIEPIEIKLKGRTELLVTAKTKISEGEEIIIKAGYYDVRKRNMTGNITKVSSKEIEKQPVQNALAALQGRVAGLEIVQQTGVPGGNYKVRIRGINSIASGNDPLYIIDGVPYTSYSMSFLETSGNILGNPNPAAGQGTSPLNSMDPLDIESIEVLKDADATAIYGSRGSNGVILITTKKGSPGKTKVDLSFYTGEGKVTRTMDLMKTPEYVGMRNEAFSNDNITPTTSNARDLLLWDTNRETDWQKKLIGGTANYNNAQLSVSGGEKNTQFILGGGYHRESTVFPGDNFFSRVSVHAGITNSSPNQKFKTKFSLNYSAITTNLLQTDLTTRALLLPPNAPALYDANGGLNWNGWTSTDPFDNPLSYTRRIYEGKTNNLVSDAVLSYLLMSNLELKASLGYTNINGNEITTNPVSSHPPDPSAQNVSNFSNSSFQNWVIEPQVHWTPSINDHHFDVLIGTTFLEQLEDGLAQTGTGFSSEALMKSLAAATTKTIGTNYYRQYRYQAAFGRINYLFRKKYILNITCRTDGSSRFGPNRQYAMFGAVGGGWIFSDEKFIQNALPFLSFGKIRMSYGTSGNDQIGDYQYINTYSSSPGPYLGGTGLQPDRLSNADFAWETNRKFEAALEINFIKDRIMSSFSYYRNRSSNQLVGFPIPVTTGFNTIQGNFPATVQNAGIEVELNTINIQQKFFKWATYLNLSIPRNKLIEFPNLQAFPAYANTYVVGEPLSIRKLYNYTGIDPATGLYTFQDINGDGVYNFTDRQTVRFTGQKLFGGLQNTFTYRNFELDVLFQFVQQEGNNYLLDFSNPGSLGNQPVFVMDRWKNSGDKTAVQRFGQANDPVTAYSRLASSQQSVSDASFVRLKNLSFSYSLPPSSLNRLHIAAGQFFVQAQNLLTITRYKGLDPELPGSVSLPPLRVISAGIHLTF